MKGKYYHETRGYWADKKPKSESKKPKVESKKEEIVNDLTKYGGFEKEDAIKLVNSADKLAEAANRKEGDKKMKFNGGLLKYLRYRYELMQSELSDVLSVNRRTIGRWETEESIPAGRDLVALAHLFNVPIRRFIIYDGEDLPDKTIIEGRDIYQNQARQEFGGYLKCPKCGSLLIDYIRGDDPCGWKCSGCGQSYQTYSEIIKSAKF